MFARHWRGRPCCMLLRCLYWAVEQLPSMTFAPLLLEPGAYGRRSSMHSLRYAWVGCDAATSSDMRGLRDRTFLFSVRLVAH